MREVVLQQPQVRLQQAPVCHVSKLPKSAEVFPDLDKIRRDAEIKHKEERNKKIGQRLTDVKDSNNKPLTSIEVAMLRLKKLLGNSAKSNKGNSSKTSSGSSLFRGFVGGGGNSDSTASRMVEMNKLKRSAKGDSRINVSDRVYVWVIYTSDDDTTFEVKSAQFFSKRWPIGKMLDSSADISKIKNVNNREVDESLRLAMFRKVRSGEKGTTSEFVYIPTSGRVEKEIKDGDEVYILRGKR
ncbi:hypothetical protein PMKS-002126 [Pichia membranifaciens]|uniref:ZFAND1-like ubiquitin-like domain-containing protein n=1 Tax=Pichia membranifaciens TaxID=4926 RepID=A0A1Q2YGI3_9ASCO|nr:hypothetical protein PMKS-002126 [Pichia membranifaciens]